jgi:hypothetical protein
LAHVPGLILSDNWSPSTFSPCPRSVSRFCTCSWC